MSIKHLKLQCRSRAHLAQEARRQMALINQCCGRNGRKDRRPFTFANSI